MRLLHVSQPVEAGVAHVVLALISDQITRGHEVHVACPPGAGLLARAVELGATVHPWAAARPPGRSVPGEALRLHRIVEALDPDVVVLHSAKAGLAGRLAIRGRRATVYAPHAWSFEAVRGPTALVSRRWEVFAARWTNLVVCVSADERDRGETVGYRGATEVIPNGVDTETRVPHDSGAARRALGLPAVRTAVCVARLCKQKGQDLLLEAWPAVRAVVPDAHLVLVGDGPARAALQAGVPAGVTFAGTRTDVDTYLAAADVVALPSRWESTPLVSLEAMAAGRPVVAFEVDGVRAALGATGVILDNGDVDGLSRALATLLSDPDAASAAGRAAREQVVAVGDLRTTLKQWEAALTKVARRPPARVGDGPPVSVVMTVLNEGPELAGTVGALLAQLTPGDELVVVDGGSGDGSLAALPTDPALRVLVEPGAGISAGRNAAVRAALHDVLVVTDAGCRPEPGFVEGMRRAFAGEDPPALAQGVYRVLARNPLERAQALACYPQPNEVEQPDPLVRAYTRAFGTGFDPRFAVARCMAFTRAAWSAAGGFPESLTTGEDVAFGLAVARHGPCVAAPHAVVGWTQRDGLAATWRMYRGYGRASVAHPRMMLRDAARGVAYLVAPVLLTRRTGRRAAAAGATAYLSLPVVRAARARAGVAATALLPVAMATKDLGKLAGAVVGMGRVLAERRR